MLSGPPAAELGDRHDVVAARPGVLDVGLAGPEAPDPDLDDVVARLQLRHVPDRVPVGPLHAVDEWPVVHVRVEVDDVEPLLVRAHDRVGDRVVASDDDRERTRVEDRAHVAGDVVEGAPDVRVDDVRVAAVHDPVVLPLVLEEAPVLLDVVVAQLLLDRPVSRVFHRQLADLARGEARAGLPRRALVARRPEDRDVGVDPGQIRAVRHPHEAHQSGERQVQAVLHS